MNTAKKSKPIQIGLVEARKKLGKLTREVKYEGVSYMITNNGEEFALLSAPSPKKLKSRKTPTIKEQYAKWLKEYRASAKRISAQVTEPFDVQELMDEIRDR